MADATTTTTMPPAATTTAPSATTAPPQTDWTSGITDEATRTWVNAKGFKDVGTLANSALNLEKLTGDLNSVIRMPKADAADFDKQMGDIYTKLGRPEKAADYKIPVPQGADPKFAEEASGWFHEIGLNTKQANALAAKWEVKFAAGTKAATDALAARDATQIAQLKAEWGTSYDANAVLVDKAAQAFGMSPEHLAGLRQAMGPAAAMKFMQQIGAKMGVSDNNFITGDGRNTSFGGMTKAEAEQRLAAIQADPAYIKAYVAGDAAKRAEMTKLLTIKSGGGMTTIG